MKNARIDAVDKKKRFMNPPGKSPASRLLNGALKGKPLPALRVI
jgi:hypothetical protein